MIECGHLSRYHLLTNIVLKILLLTILLEAKLFRLFNQSVFVLSVSVAVFSASSLLAEQSQADACFDARDTACLEELFSDIVSNPTPEKSRAIYLLGQLQEETGEFSAAQDTYMMSIGFGGGDEPQQALLDLFNAQPQVFTDPSSCLQIKSEACFSAIINQGPSESAVDAQFLLGSLLVSSENENADPVRGVRFLEAAAEGGNETAPCLLHETYQTGLDGLATNYDKSIQFGLQCKFVDPFPNLDEEHFEEYEDQDGHRAFALGETGWSFFSEGVANPEVAARLALEFCNTSPHRRSGTDDCRLINIDGTWVDNPEVPALSAFSGGVDGLITMAARDAYQDDYSGRSDRRVFVQSQNGSWGWKSAGSSDTTIDELTEKALSRCNSSWRNRLAYPCEVINVNGEWVE